ncbi:DUF3889 domain-containing protein [Brevibacillus aydinogluensis]|jgi:Protein of unknown function (DUF3889)|uniref:DUF3889 domain-containing protein n=1 Tax=Brevibacillus aydinogluensis TaxID=927786 RepID=A0AA48RJ91_9BACL|nr:DUF3889 domain-containing protein [Brevibacillus aydinogluensis]CAJ1004334.1 DUF3889 domain-containing protein [Brevibacillus aydinogluensis]
MRDRLHRRGWIAAYAAVLLLLHALPASAQPPYAKWGRLAIEHTMKTYPQAEIVDYLHVGRTSKTPATWEETFKLLLREGRRMWAVIVRIEFDKQTEKVIAIRLEETG